MATLVLRINRCYTRKKSTFYQILTWLLAYCVISYSLHSRQHSRNKTNRRNRVMSTEWRPMGLRYSRPRKSDTKTVGNLFWMSGIQLLICFVYCFFHQDTTISFVRAAGSVDQTWYFNMLLQVFLITWSNEQMKWLSSGEIYLLSNA